jgi:hypothetical protein
LLSFLQASEVFVSADILVKMMEFEWIDDLTSDVFVASFIYFPNADAISLWLAKYVAHNLQISPHGNAARTCPAFQCHSVMLESTKDEDELFVCRYRANPI